MNNTKILTISVAAYNVEKYISQLLDSVIAANRNEQLEVLVVNDGSKDATAEIAKEYEKKHPDTIKVIDKENGGHGSTINTGIENATGLYFKIVDGDDYVIPEGLAALVDYLSNIAAETTAHSTCDSCNELNTNNSYDSSDLPDLVLTDYRECYEEMGTHKDMYFPLSRKYIPENISDATSISGKKDAENLPSLVKFADIADRIERIEMHRVCFKSQLLKTHQDKIDEHCFYVDTEYIFYGLTHVQTVTYPDIMVYCYRLGRPGQSMTSEALRKNVAQHDLVNRHIVDFFEKNKGKLPQSVRVHLIGFATQVTRLSYRTYLSFKMKNAMPQKHKALDDYINVHAPEIYNNLTDAWILKLRKKEFKNYSSVQMSIRVRSLIEHLKGHR